MSREGPNHNVKTANRFFANVAKCTCLGSPLTHRTREEGFYTPLLSENIIKT